jgi:hypothetical protein
MLTNLTSFWVWTGAISLIAWLAIKYAGGSDPSSTETLGLVVIVAGVVVFGRWLGRMVGRRKGGSHEPPNPKP